MINDGGATFTLPVLTPPGLDNSTPVRLSIDANHGGVINGTTVPRSKPLSHMDLSDGELMTERLNAVDWEAVNQINKATEGNV